MKALILGVVLFFALVLVSHVFAADSLKGPLPAEVLSIYDGDTFTARIRIWLDTDLTTKIRVNGLDTPEKGWRAKCPKEAERAVDAHLKLSRLIGPEKRVVLRNVRFGKFAGRVLADVETMNGKDVATELIAAKLARPYHGGKRQGWCH